MSDIHNWPPLIRKEKSPDGLTYIMLPTNEYQLGNLLDALTQSVDNGDWWHEWQDTIGVAMEKLGIEKLQANSGKVFTREQVQNRQVR